MSKQANPTLIGSFVLGATALLTVFVLIIGGDSLNRKTTKFVIYFDESVNGLKPGSNVMFRGVPVGFVRSIELLADPTSLEFSVPVYIDIIEGRIKQIPGTEWDEDIDEDDRLDTLLDAGLRASLKSESLITGQLYIELDFYPEVKAVMRGRGGPYREIPSIQTGIQAIIEDAQNLAANIQQSIDVEQVAQNFESIIAGLDKIIESANSDDTVGQLTSTLASVETTFDQANSILQGTAGDADNVLESLDTTLVDLQSLLVTVNSRLDEDSETTLRINAALEEIAYAARSIRILAEYLEQHPEAVIRGKQDK